jgi:hypothetical protein
MLERSPLNEVIRLRATPAPRHPPYGLYDEPHRGRHTWWAVDARTLIGLTSVIGCLGMVLTLAAR